MNETVTLRTRLRTVALDAWRSAPVSVWGARIALAVALTLTLLSPMLSCRGARRSIEDVPNRLHLAATEWGTGATGAERIPADFTCDGANRSPALSWSGTPAGTRSFALVMTDPDAPGGMFVHWVVYNVQPNVTGLAEGVPQAPELSSGLRQGRNDFDQVGYGGPCPPAHQEHRYVFDLYALDTVLSLAPGATRAQIEDVVKGHVLARGRLLARYSH